MKVEAVSVTQVLPSYLMKLEDTVKDLPTEYLDILMSPEGLMAFTARVSSPDQTNPKISKLLKYCMDHGHWSVFEMVDVTFEITTSRAIAQQILRHRSFTFQEFSQRYAKADMGFETYEARRQDDKNRQNSIDDLPADDRSWFCVTQWKIQDYATEKYEEALTRGIAKEQARFLLPASTTTKLYMKGSLRSWIHYLSVRSLEAGAQREHAEIAEAIKVELSQLFPLIAEAQGWNI